MLILCEFYTAGSPNSMEAEVNPSGLVHENICKFSVVFRNFAILEPIIHNLLLYVQVYHLPSFSLQHQLLMQLC